MPNYGKCPDCGERVASFQSGKRCANCAKRRSDEAHRELARIAATQRQTPVGTTPDRPPLSEAGIASALRALPVLIDNLGSVDSGKALKVNDHILLVELANKGHAQSDANWAIHRLAENGALWARQGPFGRELVVADVAKLQVTVERLCVQARPLSRLDVPRIIESVERLYRTLENLNVEPPWLADALAETNQTLSGDPYGAPLFVCLARDVVRRRIAPSESDADVEQSKLSDNCKCVLIELWHRLKQDYVSLIENAQENRNYRRFLSDVLTVLQSEANATIGTIRPQLSRTANVGDLTYAPIDELCCVLQTAIEEAMACFHLLESGAFRARRTECNTVRTRNGVARRQQFDALNLSIRNALTVSPFNSSELDAQLVEARQLLDAVESWRPADPDSDKAHATANALTALHHRIAEVQTRLRELTAGAGQRMNTARPPVKPPRANVLQLLAEIETLFRRISGKPASARDDQYADQLAARLGGCGLSLPESELPESSGWGWFYPLNVAVANKRQGETHRTFYAYEKWFVDLDDFRLRVVEQNWPVGDAPPAGDDESKAKGADAGAPAANPLDKLKPSHAVAYRQFVQAEQQLTADPERVERRVELQEAYDWTKAEMNRDGTAGDLRSFSTWARYVRGGRKALENQVNRRRGGRSASKSIVALSDL